MSNKTTLCIVNFSGQTIRSMSVNGVSGFENNSDVQAFLPANPLPNNSSHCGYLEIAGGDPARYTLTITLDDSTTLTFSADQAESLVKHTGALRHTGSAAGLEVYRTSGGNVSTSHGTTAIYIRPESPPDHSNWMGDLLQKHPHLSLNQLTMPGSHDAGLYEVTYSFDITTQNHPEWVLTQRSRIADQLVAGARYFDLRIRNDDRGTLHGILRAAHWSDAGKTYGALGAPLNDVLNDVVSFLQTKGKKEVVVLKFSHGSDSDLCGKVVKRVKDIVGGAGLLYNPKGVALNLATARLLGTTQESEMAGKVVAVFGGDGVGYNSYWKPIEGVFPYFDMPLQNASGSSVRTPMSRLYVYDHYANDGTYEAMVADQLNKLSAYGGRNKKYLFLLSWTLTGGGAVSDIEVLAGMANPWLPKMLAGSAPKPNIVFIDFVDPYLCSTIIARN